MATQSQASLTRSRWAPALVAVALLAIAAATLWPAAGQPEETPLLCLVCGERGAADVLLNTLLFLPLGAGLALLGLPALAAAVPAAVSAAVELTQALVLAGRDPALGDLLANGLGGALGFAAIRSGPWLRRHAIAVAAVVTLLATAVPILTAWLLQPAPPDSVYYGQWTARLGHLASYDGRVVEASLADAPLPPRRLPDSAGAARRLAAGGPVSARFVAGPRPAGLAPIVSVYDDRQREVLLLGVERQDIVFRYRTRAARARLNAPDARLRAGTLLLRHGREYRLAAEATASGICIRLDTVAACDVAPTTARGWGLLYYEDELADWFGVLDALWLTAITAAVALSWGWRRSALLAGAVPTAAFAAGALPWVAAPSPLAVALAVAAAIGTAALRRRAAASPHSPHRPARPRSGRSGRTPPRIRPPTG